MNLMKVKTFNLLLAAALPATYRRRYVVTAYCLSGLAVGHAVSLSAVAEVSFDSSEFLDYFLAIHLHFGRSFAPFLICLLFLFACLPPYSSLCLCLCLCYLVILL